MQIWLWHHINASAQPNGSFSTPLAKGHFSGANGISDLTSLSSVHLGAFASDRYYSFSSYWIILYFSVRETRHIVPPCNKAGICKVRLEFQEFQILLKCCTLSSVFSSADDVSSAELMVLLICSSSVVVRPSTFALNHYSSYSSYSIILNFLLEKLAI